MSEIRWPRTLEGWNCLFWLTLGRCPIHHTKLNIDNPLYDDGKTAYCFKCEGVAMWPQGMMAALRGNAKAVKARRTADRSGGKDGDDDARLAG